MGKLMFIAFLLLGLTLLSSSMLQVPVMASHGRGRGSSTYNGGHRSGYGPGSLKSFQCPSQCTRRCSKTQYHKPCMFFCQKCCRTCLCVPPGFYGNKGVCPCYNNWKTKEGGPKCP
ncbi:gibberellin-regulated protein 6-like isoform X1 [Andrographis paniculata]|uniref:gibberellin-regulated protein 6-like isoform X1 n=1 Tax=Andrographis paniculata TaxID=175694 RepID=UPI0021E6EDD3|nr:gibberellin-regulated protein 6-like isoform X1 [Andrographis paniculata]